MILPPVMQFIMEKMAQGFAFAAAWHWLFGLWLHWTSYVEDAVK